VRAALVALEMAAQAVVLRVAEPAVPAAALAAVATAASKRARTRT